MITADVMETLEQLYRKNQDLVEYLLQHGISLNPLTKFCTVEYPPRAALREIETGKKNDIARQIYQRISGDQETGLYIHIPWCTRACTFCNFYFDVLGKKYRKQGAIDDSYIDCLENEMVQAQSFAGGRIRASSMFFGGGSPSLLSPEQVEKIIKMVENYFSLQQGSEVSMELHPEILRLKGNDYLERLKHAGINRVSIGMQSRDDSLLRRTARGHNFAESLRTYETARELFGNINIDLMYGFEPETLKSWLRTLETAFSLQPESVTAYFLEIKPTSSEYEKYAKLFHDRDFNVRNIKKALLIPVAAEPHGYEERQRSYWFRHGEKDKFVQMTEKWKSDDTILLGFGPSSYSWIFSDIENNWMFYKDFSLTEYKNDAGNNIHPVERAFMLDRDETVRRHIIFGLRSGNMPEVQLRKYLPGTSEETRKEIEYKMNALQSIGLLQNKDGIITFSDMGNVISHEISQLFGNTDHLKSAMANREPEERRYNFYSDPETLMRFEALLKKGK